MSIKVDKVSQPELAKHDSAVLDLAFAMDCTGSMGSYIATAQQNVRKIAEEIVSKEKSDVRLALVEYRDHPPQDSSFVTRVHDFTSSVSKMKSWLDGSDAMGGGDTPEAVADALHQVLKLDWRKEATKICVFIADAPPHGLGCLGDGFQNGCPDGLDPIQTGNQLAENCITMYMVGCEPSITPYKEFFMAIAHMTGGQYVPLRNAALLSQVIIGGAQEEISLQRLMEEVNEEVVNEYQAMGGAYDEDAMSRKVMERLNTKGFKSKQMQMNKMELNAATPLAMKYSKCASLAEVKKDFVVDSPAQSFSFGAPGSMVVSDSLSEAPPIRLMMAPMMAGCCPPPRAMAHSSAPPPPPSDDLFMRNVAPPMGGSAPEPFAQERLSAAPPSVDSYDVIEEQDISYGQAQRMVQKSLAMNKFKSGTK